MQQSEKGKLFSKQSKQCSTPEPISEFQRAINSLLSLSEDLGESKEDLHDWLDDFYLAYLLEGTNYAYTRGDISEHFYFYSYLQKIIRLSDEVFNFQNLSHDTDK